MEKAALSLPVGTVGMCTFSFCAFSENKKAFAVRECGKLIFCLTSGNRSPGLQCGFKAAGEQTPNTQVPLGGAVRPCEMAPQRVGGCWQAGSRPQLLRSWAPRCRRKLALPLSPELSLLAAKLQGLASWRGEIAGYSSGLTKLNSALNAASLAATQTSDLHFFSSLLVFWLPHPLTTPSPRHVPSESRLEPSRA